MADRPFGDSWKTRSDVMATNGMVATSQPLATQAGLDILKKGGNAVDAAIAANACLCVMEPTGCGIGGDLFAIVYEGKSGQVYGLNGSGRSAINSSIDDLSNALTQLNSPSKIPMFGGLSVSIPGCVDGWFELMKRFGKLGISQVLKPAIDYARNGHPVAEIISEYWQRSVKKRSHAKDFLKTFANEKGRAPLAGEIWKNEPLAQVFEILCSEGRSAFYDGIISKSSIKYLKKSGSFLSEKDFVEHTSEWIDPVSVSYRGYDVWELPPNGQGIAVLQMLNLLENFPMRDYGFGSFEHMHLFAEAKKLAFNDRARLYADPQFAGDEWEHLIDKQYANKQCEAISLKKVIKPNSLLRGPSSKGDTIYLTTADKMGNMVSLIQSNYCGIGSDVAVPEFGFCFQNRGCAFELNREHPNCYEPGKRPFHTIIPAFITKQGDPYLSFGVMGGATQPQAHTQIVMNMIDFDMGAQSAGDAMRMVHESEFDMAAGDVPVKSEILWVENGFSENTLKELKEIGHTVGLGTGMFGGYQAIHKSKNGKTLIGASESRKDGQAAGY